MVYKPHPGLVFKPRFLYYIQRFSLWKSYRKTGKIKTKFLATKQVISPPQGALLVCGKGGASGQEKHYIDKS